MYNGNTFIAILTFCSHAGLVAEGIGYFDSMNEKYGVERTIDHYINAINLLGRAERLEEAHFLLQSMPFAPTVLAWSTLPHSCLAHKGSSVRSIVRELKALQPNGSGNILRRPKHPELYCQAWLHDADSTRDRRFQPFRKRSRAIFRDEANSAQPCVDGFAR
jgi:hypothetical protein